MDRIKLLTRISYLLVTLFCIFISYEYIHDIYNLERKLVHQKLETNFKALKKDLNKEMANSKMTLLLLDNMLMQRLHNNIPFREEDFQSRMNLLLSSSINQFNLFFAFNKEFSNKFFKKDGSIYSVHRDKKLLNSKQYNDSYTFIREKFPGTNYQTDISEEWYHAGKRSSQIELTDIYFDQSSMKVWMFSLVKGVYLENEFVGVVGVDFFIESFLEEMSQFTNEMSGTLLLIDNKTQKFFINTKTKNDLKDFSPQEIASFVGKPAMNKKIRAKGDNKTYLVNSYPLAPFDWTIVSLMTKDVLYVEVFSRVKMLLILGFVILICNLLIVNYIFKHLRRRYIEILTQNQSKGITKMTEGLCHEINNPLATLSLCHHAIRRIMKENKEITAERGILSKADSAVTRINMLIQKLREISIQSSNTTKKQISMSDFVEELKIIFSEDLLKYKISLIFSSNEGGVVSCDPLNFIQVCISLIENSIEEIKGQKERWIQIQLDETSENSIIRFIDSGAGIEPNLQQRIFIPFYSTRDEGMKKGLGLSIAKNLIEQQGGKLEYDVIAKNTTFVIILPKKLTAT